jgi:hypothetical protein
MRPSVTRQRELKEAPRRDLSFLISGDFVDGFGGRNGIASLGAFA